MMQRVFDDDTGGENKIRFVLWHGLCLPMSFSFFVVIPVLLHLTVTNHWIKILLCYVKEKMLSVESKNLNQDVFLAFISSITVLIYFFT